MGKVQVSLEKTADKKIRSRKRNKVKRWSRADRTIKLAAPIFMSLTHHLLPPPPSLALNTARRIVSSVPSPATPLLGVGALSLFPSFPGPSFPLSSFFRLFFFSYLTRSLFFLPSLSLVSSPPLSLSLFTSLFRSLSCFPSLSTFCLSSRHCQFGFHFHPPFSCPRAKVHAIQQLTQHLPPVPTVPYLTVP